MNAATASEWLTAAAIGIAALLPVVAAVSLAGRDLPHLSTETVRDVAERARILLALALRLEIGEVSDDGGDVMDVADEVAYADTGRPWTYRRPVQQDREAA
ncbi:hypothetical protein ACF1AE_25450 [Streptomyces sp. NPDC014986]|uniref:hypothetical protein n=1 Tax=Streptomyces sp. NPDC014986 TaxID=3364934 RepID=UPI0036FFBBA8